MLNFLLLAAACCCLWGWADRRRARANRARAGEMVEGTRLERVLEDAIEALPTVEQHQVRTLPTADQRRLAIVHRVLTDLEERGDLSPAEVETALKAMDVAAGRG